MRKPSLKILICAFCSLLSSSLCQAEHAQGSNALQQVSSRMAAVASELLNTMQGGPGRIEQVVGYDRLALLQMNHADAARTNYVYWPYLRKGLPIDFMSAEQRLLTHDLLNTALSAQGYLTAIQIMQLEKLLSDDEVIGFPRGTENYTLSIFGEPGDEQRWGWRFEGHHLSLNFSIAPGEISVTPSFWGASPALISAGNLAGYRTLRGSHEAGLKLINALTEGQRHLTIAAGNPPNDILAGNLNRPVDSWDDWQQLPAEGIAVSTLTAAQKDLVQVIIDEVISSQRPEISQSYLAQIDVNDLRFVWYGGTVKNSPHYYRLEGPDFFFEYDLVQGNGNHVHAVWRSKNGDFGADLLMQHRRESH